mmetsp:Transcript_4052/g.12986  ORF Transcript_4052/g.12986 Transcript_4052/m.12986 type:complete len:208 (+) Transcript_4052:1250-1873(+)
MTRPSSAPSLSRRRRSWQRQRSQTTSPLRPPTSSSSRSCAASPPASRSPTWRRISTHAHSSSRAGRATQRRLVTAPPPPSSRTRPSAPPTRARWRRGVRRRRRALLRSPPPPSPRPRHLVRAALRLLEHIRRAGFRSLAGLIAALRAALCIHAPRAEPLAGTHSALRPAAEDASSVPAQLGAPTCVVCLDAAPTHALACGRRGLSCP